jgi:hypothetical protein
VAVAASSSRMTPIAAQANLPAPSFPRTRGSGPLWKNSTRIHLGHSATRSVNCNPTAAQTYRRRQKERRNETNRLISGQEQAAGQAERQCLSQRQDGLSPRCFGRFKSPALLQLASTEEVDLIGTKGGTPGTNVGEV